MKKPGKRAFLSLFLPLSTSGSFKGFGRQAMKLEAKLNLIGLSDHNDLQLVVAYCKL